jgi:hypothetical protein
MVYKGICYNSQDFYIKNLGGIYPDIPSPLAMPFVAYSTLKFHVLPQISKFKNKIVVAICTGGW